MSIASRKRSFSMRNDVMMVVVCAAMLAAVCQGTEINLPLGTLSDLGDAIQSAADASTIVMAPGIWTGCYGIPPPPALELPDKNITIRGSPDGEVIIDCIMRQDPVFVIQYAVSSVIRLESITISRSDTAITVAHGSNVELLNITWFNCTRSALISWNATVSIDQSSVVLFGDEYFGNQVFQARQHSNLTVSNTNIQHVVAYYAVIAADSFSSININNMIIEYYKNGGSGGGAIDASGNATVTAYDLTVRYSNASKHSVISVFDSSVVTLIRAHIHDNKCTTTLKTDGIMFVTSHGVLRVIDSNIHDNIAQYGSAVLCEGDAVNDDSATVFINNTVIYNQIQENGVVAATMKCAAYMSNVTVHNSKITYSSGGGIMWIVSSKFIARDSSFSSNDIQSYSSGGVIVSTNSVLDLDNVVISNNIAVIGTAIYMTDGVGYVNNCVFDNNSVSSYPPSSVIQLSGGVSNLEIKHSVISNSIGYGNTIQVEDPGSILNITASSIINNVRTGIEASSGVVVNIFDSRVHNNGGVGVGMYNGSISNSNVTSNVQGVVVNGYGVMTNVQIRDNGVCGLHVNTHVTVDSDTVICGNAQQMCGTGTVDGTPVMCGSLTVSPTGSIRSYTMVTISSSDWLTGQDDHIATLEFGSVLCNVDIVGDSVEYLAPNRSHWEVGKIRSVSANGRVSESTVSFNFTRDDVLPTLIITSPNSPTNVSPLTFILTWSKPVVLDSDRIFVTNAIVSSVDNTGMTDVFTVIINTTTVCGDVVLDVDAGAAHDIAGNFNSAPVSATIYFDAKTPNATFTAIADIGGVHVNITWDEQVQFDYSSLEVIGGSSSPVEWAQIGSLFKLDLYMDDDVIIINLPQGSACDNIDNCNDALTWSYGTHDTDPGAASCLSTCTLLVLLLLALI